MMDHPAEASGTRLTPCLDRLFRTYVKPASMILKIEHISWKIKRYDSRKVKEVSNLHHTSASLVTTTTTNSKAKYLHLVVSDDQLQVQAIFVPPSNTGKHLRLHKGDIVEIRKFQVRKAPRLNGQGHVIYLSVDECKRVGPDREIKAIGEAELEFEGGFLREDVDEANDDAMPIDSADARIYRKPSPVRLAEASLDLDLPGKRSLSSTLGLATDARYQPKRRHLHQRSKPPKYDTGSDDEVDSFDTLTVSQSQIENRREALRRISQHSLPHTPGPSSLYYYSEVVSGDDDDDDDLTEEPFLRPAKEYGSPSVYVDEDRKLKETYLVKDHQSTAVTEFRHGSASLPIHTLSSLLDSKSSLPRTCSVLAVVSWVSPSIIFKPNTPYPPKRHIKIHDPSISHRQAGITVAVFVDAKGFLPPIGTIGLLRGVVVHTFGEEIILNKYARHSSASDSTMGTCPDEPEDWFVTDQRTLDDLGFDVTPLQIWWNERVKRKEGSK
ncbi:uncharacterized protein PV06_01297 [Exophiala oligosperma]|uniref:Uncharacterized protein n=1 Tax=Exophiala oligosperma TaxID=215243 RepID=A0A0D2CFP1_9EURO|nr:uncharacterized protein PV06_01297 [Exophiala oligosperma]KIW48732.1 hypothetical protein PV06_01297 [Exophiala oligosperma]